jgi:hypothetical protein
MTKDQALKRATVLFAEADSLWRVPRSEREKAQSHEAEANRLDREAAILYGTATELKFNTK